MKHLRIGEDLIQVIDGPARDACFVESFDPLITGQRPGLFIHNLINLPASLSTLIVGIKIRIGNQILDIQYFAQGQPGFLGARCDGNGSVRGLKHTVGGHHHMIVSGAGG